MYKHGFQTSVKTKKVAIGVNRHTVANISSNLGEDKHFFNRRMEAYDFLCKQTVPTWSKLDLSNLDLDALCYFTQTDKDQENLQKIKQLSKKLRLPQDGSNDLILDSEVFAMAQNPLLKKTGVIFCSMMHAIQYHTDLVKKYLGSVVPYSDNYFTCLNSAFFSGGTFIYIPEKCVCPVTLSTYFRINTKSLGQLERTLIIVDKEGELDYFEGCSSVATHEPHLHAAVVELIALEGAKINYTTVQNWYVGEDNKRSSRQKLGGVYNLVTKRGLAHDRSCISWRQVEQGAAVTWKYPSVVLQGAHSYGEFHSLSLTKGNQQAETGTKMIHLGRNTKSTSMSYNIGLGNSLGVYRSLVYIDKEAHNSYNWSKCDSLMMENSNSCTVPTVKINNSTSSCEHEAQAWSLSDQQIQYLQARGINENQASTAIVAGFCKPITKQLPLEWSAEVEDMLLCHLR